MRKLRLATLAAALCIGATSLAHAQANPQPQGQRRGFNMGAMVMQGITLSTDQQAKVDSITTKYQEQMRKARDDARAAGGDMSSMRAQMQQMREQELTELKAVLTTDDQRAAFDKNVENMRANMGRMRPPSQD